MTTFRKEKKLIFDPTTEVNVMCKGKTVASMLLYASFPFISYATCPYSEKVDFWHKSNPLGLPCMWRFLAPGA